MQGNSFTYKLTEAQQDRLLELLRAGNYTALEVPHTRVAVEGPNYRVNLYTSGKCLVQGKGAREWVEFTLEPLVLEEARLGYEEELNPQWYQPHMGVDESGKGDFFGPLVIAGAYADSDLVKEFEKLQVKDSKRITSDRKARDMADEIRKVLKGRFAYVTIGPEAYNRLYTDMRNVNRMLAWGHARVIENLLDRVPGCPIAVSDQFGPERQIQQALMKKGRSIELRQMPRAESDPAVAAASILARAGFVEALEKMGKTYEITIPKGASAKVKEVAQQLVTDHGPEVLLKTAKCHFKTTDDVLAACGAQRSDLPAAGQAVSKQKGRP